MSNNEFYLQDPDNNSHQDPHDTAGGLLSNGSGEYVTQLLVGPPGSIAHPPGGMSRSAGVAQWREWAAEGVGTPRGLPAGKEEDCHSTNSEEDKPIINRMRQTKVKLKKKRQKT